MFSNQNLFVETEAAPELAEALSWQRAAASAPTIPVAEGQLAVDVVETDSEIVITSALAGTRPEDIELHLASDVFTVRGRRSTTAPADGHYFYRECFWGVFSRTIVLPTEVKSELARAEYKNGILTVSLPKARPGNTIPILVIED